MIGGKGRCAVQDPASLYRLEPDTDATLLRASVMIVSLTGFMDAGRTQRLLTRHLLANLEHSVVATFDVDQLLDYRGRRPMMTFDRDHWRDYADPNLVLYRVVDRGGTPFLLLHGVEPDYQWERVVEAVRQLGSFLGVTLTVGINGIPMAVPHTRPIGMTVHATSDRLKGGQEPLFDTVTVPASLAALLELRLGELGEEAVGYAVHVPHYLAQTDFPAGALAGLEALCSITGLHLPRRSLQQAAAASLQAVTEQVAESDEAHRVVAALEQQYDTVAATQQRIALLAGEEARLPTADELGQEFEAYLRSQASGEDSTG